MDAPINYITSESLESLIKEKDQLKDIKIPEIAKRIDEAKQQGDLSENAEYHQAREDMSWARGRLHELEQLIENSQIIKHQKTDQVNVGSKIAVKVNGEEKKYTIVGPQEIDPAKGFISNESPLGEAFIGHKKGDTVEVETPAGLVSYKISEIN